VFNFTFMSSDLRSKRTVSRQTSAIEMVRAVLRPCQYEKPARGAQVKEPRHVSETQRSDRRAAALPRSPLCPLRTDNAQCGRHVQKPAQKRTHAARRAENCCSITSLAPGWKRNRHIDAKRLGGRTMGDHFGGRRLHHGARLPSRLKDMPATRVHCSGNCSILGIGFSPCTS
jgi:hypothetical protein